MDRLDRAGVGYDLRVNRTYNSRSLFNGLFGFGWCSDYETKIEVTPESNLRLTECGGGMEIIFTTKNFNPGKNRHHRQSNYRRKSKSAAPISKPTISPNLEKELKTNDFMREEFGRRMNIKGKVEDGVHYLANGREAENITLKAGQYKRTLSDGTYQLFDAATGHLTHMYDKNQNYLKLAWEKDHADSAWPTTQAASSASNTIRNKKVSEIIGPNGLSAHITWSRAKILTEVTDAKKQKYKFAYDDVHNLKRIDYPGQYL